MVVEYVGFFVWFFWLVMVLFMFILVYGFFVGDKFLFGVIVILVGVCLCFFYIFVIVKFGGCNWIIFFVLVLLILIVGSILLLVNFGLLLWLYLVCGVLVGFGGGNFVVFMMNINVFFL